MRYRPTQISECNFSPPCDRSLSRSKFMAIMSRPIDLHNCVSSMRKGNMEDGANSKPSVTLELQAFELFSKRKQGLESQLATSPKSASSVILSDIVVPFPGGSSSARAIHAEWCSTSAPLQRCWAPTGSSSNWHMGFNKAELSDESMLAAASFDSSCFHGQHSELSLRTVTQMQTPPHQDNQLRLFTARSWQEQSPLLNFVDAMRVNESEINFHHPNASLGNLFGSPHLLNADSTPGLYGYSIEPVQSQEDERERSLDASMLDLTSKLGSTQDVAANVSLVLPETAGDFPMQMGFNILDDSYTLSLRSQRYIPSDLEVDTYMKPTYSEAIYLSNEDLENPLTLQYPSNLRPSGLHAPIPEAYFHNSHSVNGNSFEFLRNPTVSVDGRQVLETTANWEDSYYAASNMGSNWKEESKAHFPLSMQNDWQNLSSAMHRSSLVLGFSQDQRSLKRPMHDMDMEHTSSANKRMHVENDALKRSSSWASLGYEEDTRDEATAVIFKPSSSAKKSLGPALNTNLKPRARQGSANDPQSIAARHRRERISERLKTLQNLIPNGSKVDLVTMLEKAITYVKFLQLQVRVLTTDEYWPNQDTKEKQTSQQDAAEVTSKASPNDDDHHHNVGGGGGGGDDEDDQPPPDQTHHREFKSTRTQDLTCQPSSSH